MQGFRSWFLMVCCGLAATLVQSAPPVAVQGIVTKVIDGDSLWLTPPGKPPIEVRLRDIDAPESCQPWGPEARKALADLALNKVATLQVGGRDSYGRTLGTLLVEELQVNRFLVENGHAWSLRSRWDQGPMVKQEKMARALSRGLHAAPGAVQPWEFRRTQGPCAAADVQAPSPPARMAQPVSPPVRVAPLTGASGGPFRCDGRTHCSQMGSCAEAKFFLANCPGVKMDGDRDGVPCEDQHCR
jgi:endonuclease YncB( thermonuclease family)